MLLADVHVFAQRPYDIAFQLAAEFQTHGSKPSSALNQLHHELAVIDVVLIQRIGVDIGVARDADEALLPNGIARENLGHEMQNQLFSEHVGLFLGGNLDQPREHAGAAGDDAELALAVFAFKHDRRINVLVAQERERLTASDDDRGNQRRDFAVEIPLQLFAFLPANLPEINQPDARFFDAAQQLRIDKVLPLIQRADRTQHFAELLRCGHVRLILAHGRRDFLLIHQRAHAHHEEFIEIALINRSKAQPLAKRRQVALRFLQNAFVEFEPGKLTVHVNRIGHAQHSFLYRQPEIRLYMHTVLL